MKRKVVISWSCPLVALTLLLWNISVVAAEPSHGDSRAIFPSDLKKISCDVYELAQRIFDGNGVVPEVIYHFGKREYLLEDIQARTIPEKAWNEFIMGNKTTYNLK